MIREPAIKTLFGAHESFHLREGWLRKGLLGVQKNPYLFSDPFPEDVLGVGHNMVKAIRYWLQATNLVQAQQEAWDAKKTMALYPTLLANLILEHDSYLEQDGTLWLLHHQLATNKIFAPTWFWFFNMFGVRHFTQDLLLSHLQRYVEGELRRKIKSRTLEREFRCLIRTYVRYEEHTRPSNYEDSFDCPLTVLGLLQHLPMTRSYRISMPSRESLHPLLVAYALTEMRARLPLRLEQISLRDALLEPGSPGRLFALDAETLYEYIMELCDQYPDLVGYSRTAGLNMITVRQVDGVEVLKRYYHHVGSREGTYA